MGLFLRYFAHALGYATSSGDFTVVAWESTLSWDQALHHCKAMGLEFASVRDAAEHAELSALAEEAVWIGLSYDGDWVWSNGQALNFTAWAEGEPNNYQGDEFCVELDDGEWNDTGCDNPIMSSFACRA